MHSEHANMIETIAQSCGFDEVKSLFIPMINPYKEIGEGNGGEGWGGGGGVG